MLHDFDLIWNKTTAISWENTADADDVREKTTLW